MHWLVESTEEDSNDQGKRENKSSVHKTVSYIGSRSLAR